MAEAGARVTMLDIDAERIRKEQDRLEGAGHDVRGEVVDVTDHSALDRAVDAAAQRYGRLDVVFANAGVDSGPGFVKGWVGAQRERNSEGALENYTDARWEPRHRRQFERRFRNHARGHATQ